MADTQTTYQRKSYIYKITSPNNKIYIGQTNDILKRKSAYRTNKFKGQVKLWNNCEKYNWNPVDYFEIIDECDSRCSKLLNMLEKFWIKEYNSYLGDHGLNLTPGGDHNVMSEETKQKISTTKLSRTYIVSEETRKKLSNVHLGFKHSQETKNKMSTSQTGRTFSDEAKVNMSIAHIGKNMGKEPWNKGIKLSEEQKSIYKKLGRKY